MAANAPRPVRFMGDSREVLRELPDEVKSEVGYALRRVQQGKTPESAKPLKGIAPGVLEIVSDFRGDTSGLYTRQGSLAPFTFCTCFRRNPSGALRRRNVKSNS